MLFHGMIRDEHGKKMSKSFGNTIDPTPLITEHGADTLRFALARKTRPGADIPFGDDDLKGARTFLTKLRSITTLTTRLSGAWEPDRPTPTHLLDRWLLTRLDAALAQARAGYDAGDLAQACGSLTRLAQDDLSGLYLEARKDALYAGEAGARSTLSHTLTGLLLALHPMLPFATEELAESLGWAGLMDHEHLPPAGAPDEAAAAAGEQLRALRDAARAHRTRHRFAPGAALPAHGEGIALWAELCRTAHLTDADPAPATTFTHAAAILHLPTAPQLDERQRGALTRKLAQAHEQIDRLTARLADPGFLGRSPAAAQDKARRDREANQAEARRLTDLLTPAR